MPDKLHKHFQWVGVAIYLLALLIVSICFTSYALKPLWIAWGISTVLFFFGLTYWFHRRWQNDDSKKFIWKVFLWAFGIRAVYVGIIIFYYYFETGVSFEYGAADSWAYHRTACYLADLAREGRIHDIFRILNGKTLGFSDQGYTLYLTALYTCFGKNILGPRLLKALMSAYMCVVIYKLTLRNLGDKTARIAAVMAVFLPQFIHYNGTYMKETEMIFIATLALERFDYLVHSKRYTFWNIVFPILLTALTFGFRTIIGMALIASYLMCVICCEKTLISNKARIVFGSSVLLLAVILALTPIGWEMIMMFKINFSTGTANARYMAPGFLTLPLTNLVEVANPNQKMMNGTFFVKNYLAFFALLSILAAFREKQWRQLSHIGTYTLIYALMIAFSFAFKSERYHLPVMPGLLIMAAFAMTHFRKKNFKWFYAYGVLLLIAIVLWNYLKLAKGGLV